MVARVQGLALLGTAAPSTTGAHATEPSAHLQTAGGTPVVHMWEPWQELFPPARIHARQP